MQALQKAAKEREGATQSPSEARLMAADLALEPLEAIAAAKPGATPASHQTSGGPTPAHAAAVMQGVKAPGILDRMREHRNAFYAGLIGLLVIGYGIYFYISVYHPTLFRRPFTSRVVVNPSPAAPVTPAPAQPEAGAAPTAAGAPPASPDVVPPVTAPVQNKPVRSSEGRKATVETRPRAQPVIPAAAPEPRQPRNSIAVRPGGESPRLNPQLSDAYDALRAGRIDDAKKLYDALLLTEPRNIDALLGRAMVAQQTGDTDSAIRYLYQVIQLDPSNALAQGGLINLLGRADPQSAESRLKSLIAKDPSAFLYFSLGNLYADQGNWQAAQSAYFQAHHLQPDNAEYVFNLAVSLEHLGQPKLALGFYRQALALAKSGGRASFDSAAVQERVARLAANAE